MNGPILTLKMRTGESKAVNTSNAINVQRPLNLGIPFTALGSTIDATGALVATSIVRAKGSGEYWPPDRWSKAVVPSGQCHLARRDR